MFSDIEKDDSIKLNIVTRLRLKLMKIPFRKALGYWCIFQLGQTIGVMMISFLWFYDSDMLTQLLDSRPPSWNWFINPVIFLGGIYYSFKKE